MIRDFVPLAALDDLVFGAWDPVPDDAYTAAVKAGVLDRHEHLEPIGDFLRSVKPMPAVFDQTYVKRLERLEEICQSFEGVEKVFAMQAGREVRVMVQPDGVDDLAAGVMARDIAKQVEEELQYPGQIKITVVRESRSIEFAR